MTQSDAREREPAKYAKKRKLSAGPGSEDGEVGVETGKPKALAAGSSNAGRRSPCPPSHSGEDGPAAIVARRLLELAPRTEIVDKAAEAEEVWAARVAFRETVSQDLSDRYGDMLAAEYDEGR
jgi:type VI protein secretion system component VasF